MSTGCGRPRTHASPRHCAWTKQAVDKAGAAAMVSGMKPFCSGAGLVDRALVTVREGTVAHLVDLDARAHRASASTPAVG